MYDWDKEEPVREYIDACWERHLLGTDGPCEGNIEQYSRVELTRRLTEEIL
jgi:hypothetical protein